MVVPLTNSAGAFAPRRCCIFGFGVIYAWEVFDSYTLPKIELVVVLRDDTWQIDVTEKAIDDEALSTVFARSLKGKVLDFSKSP